IRVGSIGLGGLTLPGLLRLRQAEGATPRPKARSVILLFLSGGPAHMDMWDMKPDAPEEIRGTFQPIATNVPGIQITEHMPRMARLADKYAIIRSVHHRQANHPAAAYWMMIGSPIARPVPEAGFMSRADRPHPGSALAKLLGRSPALPPFVMLPEAMQPNGPERSGQHAGFLGAAYDPYRINSDPNQPDYSPGALEPPPDVPADRLEARRALLDIVSQQAEHLERALTVQGMDASYTKAFDLLASPAAQRAFDITAEPDATRDRYGRHVFGQSVLLARRLVEAGVRLVHVNWVRHDGGKGGQGYDSHRDHLDWAKTELLPPTDAAFAALIEDLDARGLLDETLVILMGEFGRTPRFNKNAGRDHWPNCFSVVLAGGGIRGGQVLGASDKNAAYPAADPVGPEDLIATLYYCLGVDPHTLIYDQQDRPYILVDGTPLHALL
ncbi:MAG: DUF1501 domain-containing protein, partial [Isosphaeraceae bacterium]|nr:DUF1501 domain-containing protein [Isosphaeraceae bacterium]